MTKRAIIIRQIESGLGGTYWGHIKTWRAYGTNDKGREFQLRDERYEVMYPLDCSTEKQIRNQCARQYPGHPIIKGN